ncbi:hypothetical protein HD554DRAFT_2122544 [Boletus coccyginus]|nr:hypothetical protein HD554DRAFT_2122544 [Boletus coccyginus]
MHPYHHIFLHRGPSRVFWFLIGAGVATWWHHRDHRTHYLPCLTHHRPVDAPNQEAPLSKSPWAPDRTPTGYQQRDWEQERERLRHLQKRAGETVVDLSESTLDSIVSGAESLKAVRIHLLHSTLPS